MYRFILYLLCFIVPAAALAQPTSSRGWYEREDIEDIEIGWIKTIQFKEPPKAFAQHGWRYTTQQLKFTQHMVTCIQQTFVPRGLLGEMVQSIYAPPPSQPVNSTSYNFNEAEKNNYNAVPNTYGAMAKLYMLLQKTSSKKFTPINGMANYYSWNIMANNVELITKQIVALSSPEEYYCTMPRYTVGMKGEYDHEMYTQFANYRNFIGSPSLKNYDHYMIPAGAVGYSRETFYVVVMTKDNAPLPFEQVTIGQLLSRLEKQLPQLYMIALNNGTQMSNLLGNAQRGMQLLKAQFVNQQNEFAYIPSSATQIDIIDLANLEPGSKISWIKTQPLTQENKNNTTSNFPLLRLKKGVKESLATGTPQWIVFRLTKGGSPGNQGEIHLMETFINRFNYDYVYNFYFGQEKVITPYKPHAFTDAAPQGVTASDESKRLAADKSILYFEDFSATANGAKPATWKTQRSEITGNEVAITEVAGAKGKWLKLKRTASPTEVAFPLSGDFTISFDVLVQKGDVPWGTPGMQLQLYSGTKENDAADPHRFTIDVSPGDMNRKDAAGWVMIGRNAPAGYMTCKVESYYSIPFTGSNAVNQVNMAVRRAGEKITVLCNNAKVFECEKAFPSAMNFRAIQFYVNEKNTYHIGNVMIKR